MCVSGRIREFTKVRGKLPLSTCNLKKLPLSCGRSNLISFLMLGAKKRGSNAGNKLVLIGGLKGFRFRTIRRRTFTRIASNNR